MSAICTSFDTYFDAWCRQAGALCFLLTRDARGADYACFQSFLRMGAAKNPAIGEDDARRLLFSSAVRLCDDFFLKKPHRMPSKTRLQEQNLPFPITDALYSFLKLPFARRAALALHHFGFPVSEIAVFLRRREAAVHPLLADPGIPGWQEAVDSALMTEGEAQTLSDRIYERFAERSVGVENAIHDARNAFDRAAPYLALFVLALALFAVWFVQRMPA
ncbi:MAG: hypothetical protein IJD94_09595 [Clostridia bacterium]|nr:hypothetical protein [Clostridia bacterium]